MATLCPKQTCSSFTNGISACEDNDFSFSITSSQTFFNAGGSFTVPCPEGFVCEGGDQTVIIPGGGGGKPWIPPPPTPNTPTILRLMGCSSEIVRELEPVYTIADYNAAIASILAEWQLQQATCEARQRQRPRRIVIRWLSPRELPTGCLGNAYSYQLLATGGTAFRFSVPTPFHDVFGFCVGTVAQPGDVIDYFWEPLQSFPQFSGYDMGCATGLIYGIPLLAGTFPNFIIRITDSLGRSATKSFTLRTIGITNGVLIPMTDPPEFQLPDAPKSTPYNEALIAANTVGPITWQLVSGTLPDGLNFNTGSGVISGTSTALEESRFSIGFQEGSSPICAKHFRLNTCRVAAPPTCYWKLDSIYPIGGGSFGTPDLMGVFDLNDLNSSSAMDNYIGPAKINSGFNGLPNHADFGDNGPLGPVLDSVNASSFTVRLWMKTDSALADNLMAEHRSVWDIAGVFATQKLRVRIGQPPFFGSDTVTSSVLWTPNVWHRVIIWRDLVHAVIGIVVDNNAPDTVPLVNGAVSNSQYLFFGTDTPGILQSYDEIGYWIGYVWTADDRLCDWNGGVGVSWHL